MGTSQDKDQKQRRQATTPAAGAAPARTGQEIQSWCVEYLARQLEFSPDRIDVTVPFDDFALDSATLIAMSGDLEQWLGLRVDPTLLYDYPTIAQLSEHLAQVPGG